MIITFKAKSRNTLPAEQVYKTALSVQYREKYKVFEIEYTSGSEGRTGTAFVSSSYYIAEVK